MHSKCSKCRKLGLWLSAALPTLRVALERGMPVDFFGDYLYNKAHHRRPHDGVLAAWADAMRARPTRRSCTATRRNRSSPGSTMRGTRPTSQNPMQGQGDAMK